MLSDLLSHKNVSELTSLWQSTPFIQLGLKSAIPIPSFTKPSLTRWEVFQIAEKLSYQLPKGDFSVILLFQQRHHFLIGLLATALKNGRCILPPNLADTTLNDLSKKTSNLYVMAEHCPPPLSNQTLITEQTITLLMHNVQKNPRPFNSEILKNYLQTVQDAEIWLFTSGTTGTPKQVIKTWKSMILSAELAIKRFQLMHPHYIVATVPCQHMFGLETTIFWPLFSTSTLWFERPIFPEDILEALNANVQHSTYLISTPLHLQKILAFKLQWPGHLSHILSATAPLPLTTAQEIEASFNAHVLEVYGSTETASIASRQPTKSQNWQAYEQVLFQTHQNQVSVKTPGLTKFQPLNDQIKQIDDTHFVLGQRDTDLIKVAGKRASLTELNQHLQNISKVSEAVFIQPEDSERLMAFVVSTLSSSEILNKLRQSIDPVFLPRPIHFITELPRNELGKILYNQLLSKRTHDAMLLQSNFQISAQHPCLKGHFKNQPIVPGVVLLEQVEHFIRIELTQWKIIELKQVKFIAKVLPDENIEVQLHLEKLKSLQTITFNLQKTAEGTTFIVATGKFKLSVI